MWPHTGYVHRHAARIVFDHTHPCDLAEKAMQLGTQAPSPQSEQNSGIVIRRLQLQVWRKCAPAFQRLSLHPSTTMPTTSVSAVTGRSVLARVPYRKQLVDDTQTTGCHRPPCACRRQLLLACSAPSLLAPVAEQAALAAENDFVTLPSGLRVLNLRCAACTGPSDCSRALHTHGISLHSLTPCTFNTHRAGKERSVFTLCLPCHHGQLAPWGSDTLPLPLVPHAACVQARFRNNTSRRRYSAFRFCLPV